MGCVIQLPELRKVEHSDKVWLEQCNYLCDRCERDILAPGDRVFTLKHSWLCRVCWYELGGVEIDQFYLDKRGCCFKVPDRTWILYPWGKHKPFPVDGAVKSCRDTFHEQHSAMFDVVLKYMPWVRSIARQCADKFRGKFLYPPLDYGTCYNLAMTAAMKGGLKSIANVEVESTFGYIMMEWGWTLRGILRRRGIHAELMGPVLSIDRDMPAPTNSYLLKVDEAIRECEKEVGDDTWRIMQEYVIEEKSYREIGRDRGLSPMTVRSRVKDTLNKFSVAVEKVL